MHLPVPLADLARKLAIDLPRKSEHRVIRILPLPVPVLLSTPFVLPILLISRRKSDALLIAATGIQCDGTVGA